MDIVVIAYHHIYVDASNHYAPEPSIVSPTVNKARVKVAEGSSRTSWFFNTSPGVPHVAATYLLHISAVELVVRLELTTYGLQDRCATGCAIPAYYKTYL